MTFPTDNDDARRGLLGLLRWVASASPYDTDQERMMRTRAKRLIKYIEGTEPMSVDLYVNEISPLKPPMSFHQLKSTDFPEGSRTREVLEGIERQRAQETEDRDLTEQRRQENDI